MRRRLFVGFALVLALSIAAVLVAIASVTGPGDLERVRSALQLQTNCPHIAVQRPSRAPVIRRWAGSTLQTADVVCDVAGPRLIYVEFIDRGRLDTALATTPPAASYCRLGDAILMAQLVGEASTMLSDVCQSVGGTLMNASAEALE
jgi:hypothetical protein